MTPTNNILAKTKDQENQGGSDDNQKTTRPTEQSLKCPRCDSANTKFCYYNNYSLSQPRHFCKTCRRYWTNGGALRNVPIGGGCRKNKKMKTTSSSSSSLSRLSCDSKDSASSSSELAGLRFFHGININSPSLEFHLGGAGLPFPSRLQYHHFHPPPTTATYNYNNHSQNQNQFSSFGDVSATNASSFQLDNSVTSDSLMGLNYPFSGSGFNGATAIQGMNSLNVNNSLASSIESLSSINQDLHWKLQQQRLAMVFGGDNQKDNGGSVSLPQVVNLENQTQKPQPNLFQSLEVPKTEIFQARKEAPSVDQPTEWFFTPTTAATSNGGNGHDNNTIGNNNNNWSNGVNVWGDVQQPYSTLP